MKLIQIQVKLKYKLLDDQKIKINVDIKLDHLLLGLAPTFLDTLYNDLENNFKLLMVQVNVQIYILLNILKSNS